jgi:hypothetical protein
MSEDKGWAWKNGDGKEFWESQFNDEKSVDKSLFIDKLDEYLTSSTDLSTTPSFLSSIVDFTMGMH